MIRKNGFVLFYNGEFSQWHIHHMTIRGVSYNCCEQYMMAMKAKFFGDKERYAQIMKSDSPEFQKRAGRLVDNFNNEKWNQVCRQIVYDGNYAKFHDPVLRGLLMSTWDDEIVEASAYDTIWGIGLGEADDRCFNKTQWQGTNWLGEAIMQVRAKIRSEIGLDKTQPLFDK